MAEIISFIAGCIFTLLVTGVCLFVAYKVLDFKSTLDIKQHEQRKRIEKTLNPLPQGGVIKPKTPQQRALEKNEELKAFADLLDPNKA